MLDLSTKSSYAARAVYELAKAWDDGTKKMNLKEIVAKQDIPVDYMEKLLFKLKKAGMVKTVRGKHGGYMLSKEPSEIKVSDIVIMMENPTKRLNCMEKDSKDKCDMFEYCMIKYVWSDAYRAMLRALGKYTFQDLVDMEKKRVVSQS